MPVGAEILDRLETLTGGLPIKRFFRGPPSQQYADAVAATAQVQDPVERARRLADVRDQMFAAGYEARDTLPVLKGSVDHVLYDLRQQPDGEQKALNVERLFGRVSGPRPGTVGQMLRVPGQIESEQALTGERQAATVRNLGQAGTAGARTQFIQGPHTASESALTGERQAAAVHQQAAAGEAARGGLETDIERKAIAQGIDSLSPEEKQIWYKKTQPAGMGTSTDAQDIATAISEGRQPPTLTGMYRYAAPVRAELARQGYDLTTATRDWQAIQRHLSTLNGPQQERLRQAITFTYDSLDVIDELYNQWKQLGATSGYRVLNKAALATSKQVPGQLGAAATALEAQINDLTSELATVYKGGLSSTDDTLRLAASNLGADYTEEQFRKSMQVIRRNLQIRRNSILQSEPVGVTPGSPLTGSPAARAPALPAAPAAAQPAGPPAGPRPAGATHWSPSRGYLDAQGNPVQ
jgi:hypothetical protein